MHKKKKVDFKYIMWQIQNGTLNEKNSAIKGFEYLTHQLNALTVRQAEIIIQHLLTDPNDIVRRDMLKMLIDVRIWEIMPGLIPFLPPLIFDVFFSVRDEFVNQISQFNAVLIQSCYFYKDYILNNLYKPLFYYCLHQIIYLL